MADSEKTPNAASSKRPLPRLAAAQVIALVFTLSLSWLTAVQWSPMPPAVLWAGQGVFAAAVAWAMGLRGGWLVFQALAPLSMWGLHALALPSWLIGLLLIALAAVFWNAAGERVPLYLSNPTTRQALLDVMPPGRGRRFVDLGCGLGGPTLALAAMRPDSTFVGVESAPVPFLLAKSRQILSRRDNARIVYGDIWQVDLSAYDIVYVFLSPAPMTRLYRKARAEMRPGSLLVSNSFAVPGEDADEVLVLDDGRQTHLHIWRL